jgi:hypothetical protein
MSTIAKQTAIFFLLICLSVYLYGIGFKRGASAQLTYHQVIDICAAQFFDAVKQHQKAKGK